MFNSHRILIRACCRRLRRGYREMYGGRKHDYEEVIDWVGRMALETIATSDALYHNVDHGKRFIRERFGDHDLLDAEVIGRNIELTRFPVPAAEGHRDTRNFPGLVRAADLIGQLSDPAYLNKLAALFWEFEESGVNR